MHFEAETANFWIPACAGMTKRAVVGNCEIVLVYDSFFSPALNSGSLSCYGFRNTSVTKNEDVQVALRPIHLATNNPYGLAHFVGARF